MALLESIQHVDVPVDDRGLPTTESNRLGKFVVTGITVVPSVGFDPTALHFVDPYTEGAKEKLKILLPVDGEALSATMVHDAIRVALAKRANEIRSRAMETKL